MRLLDWNDYHNAVEAMPEPGLQEIEGDLAADGFDVEALRADETALNSLRAAWQAGWADGQISAMLAIRKLGESFMMQPEVSQTLWTPEDLARYLGVPVQTLYARRNKSIGPRAVRIGRHLRYRPTDVHAWLEARARA